MAATKKRKRKAKAKKRVETTGDRKRAKRQSKDRVYFAVNVYIHKDLLDKIDDEAEAEDRTRKAQLERILCRAFSIDHASLEG